MWGACACGLAAALSAHAATPLLQGELDRPLRYTPQGTDFVITNGAEFFNRPLYTNTAFRVDGGDKPEFSLYLPGRGGNLRVGLVGANGVAKWLNDAAQVVTRYRPGSLIYEITDPLLGDNGKLTLTAMVLPAGQGLIVQAQAENAPPVTLVWAYGGANGQAANRGGDIGEGQAVSRVFQLTPANCAGDNFSIDAPSSSFWLQYVSGNAGATTSILGLAPPATKLAVADANQWNSLPDLLASAGTPTANPLLVGQTALASGKPLYFALQRRPQPNETIPVDPTYREITGEGPESAGKPAAPLAYAELPQVFAAAEARRAAIAGKVSVDTPDPYINAAVAALCVAADGIWDEGKGNFQHGAVAWRTSLLGWRGPYSSDDLGWFDRFARNFDYWSAKQNTRPIAEPPGPDPAARFARDEPALHSNGDMSNSHYDMNLIAVDALFRHLLWTGDLDYARQMWPVIQRHLAWEQRLFRRPYGGGGEPLYEAYAAIWASDDLAYDGGGSTHGSAFNYFENLMAARLARLLGEDPAPYDREAALIYKAMHDQLWLQDRGWYAEYKDWNGLQLTHPSAAVWSIYHAIDEQAATPLEAWQMTRYVDTKIPHIPLQGANVPPGYATLTTSDWMPYTWSLNNVVMGETAQTALAFWQSNRPNEAFQLFKGCLLDSMYLGLSPGNAGTMTYYDAYRGESQRDFGDDIGALSRAVVEGLFGIHPDALAGTLLIQPGFPSSWDHASIHHPALDYAFHTEGPVQIPVTTVKTTESSSERGAVITRRTTTSVPGFAEVYTVTPHFSRPMTLRLQVPARRTEVASLTINGVPYNCSVVEDAVETPRIEINAPPANSYEIRIVWAGDVPVQVAAPAIAALGRDILIPLSPARLLQFSDPQGALNNYEALPASFRATVVGRPGARTAFLDLQQGQLHWWAPLTFEVRPPYEIVPADFQTPGNLTFTLRNNNPEPFNGTVNFNRGAAAKQNVDIPPFGESAPITLPAALPGTNHLVADLGQGRTVEGDVTNWQLAADPARLHFEPVNLAPSFNDKVTQIFQNQYASPRSPYPSLSIQLNGFGNWTNVTSNAFNVDDRGLRAAALAGNGTYLLASQGIPFATPGDPQQKNILFTSQWDNYPHEASVPLDGKAAHVYLLMAGSTFPMQSRLDNGEVVVTYTDGSSTRLALTNPATWWPIDQDYFIDDFGFRYPGAIPPRVDLGTGRSRTSVLPDFYGRGGSLGRNGGSATVLDLPLDPGKELKSLTVRTLANDVVIGLMSATLVR